MIWILLFISFGFAFAEDKKYVTPEELDELWASGQDKEFAKILGMKESSVRPDKSAEAYAGTIPKNESYFCGFKIPKGKKGINFLNLKNELWTGGKIPYFISKKSYDAKERQLIIDAINAFNDKTRNLKLVPYKGQKDYVFVYSGNGCAVSDLGRKGGPQYLTLQKDSCLSKPGFVQHEFMHIAGLDHEHNRYDRDEHIKLLKEIEVENLLEQFRKSESPDSTRLGRYDYYSVMHYEVELKKGKPLFKILKQGIDRSRVGQHEGLTDIDVQKIDKLYS